MSLYEECTNGIEITVEACLVAEKCKPELGYYFYAYRVTMHNLRPQPVQLISRQWLITDGSGHHEEVRGEGVIGLQPTLQPGGSFDYTSFCPLRTATGNMRGFYTFRDLQTRAQMKIRIPLFFFRPDHRTSQHVQEVVV